MMRDQILFGTINGEPYHTRDERWDTTGYTPTYVATAGWEMEQLGFTDSGECLIIGSPIFEARAIEALGWRVTYLDVRVPPHNFARFVQADAIDMPFGGASFDAVDSNCVLTHAGLTRYGDAAAFDDGDERMLAEIARVLRPGGVAVLTFGACLARPQMICAGTFQRMYTPEEVKRMTEAAGLVLQKVSVFSPVDNRWLTDLSQLTTALQYPDYICVRAMKL